MKLNENFTTLNARALVAEKKNDATMAGQLRAKALTVANEADMNNYGYTLLQSGKTDEALKVFRQNVAKYPESWNTYDSLGEGLAAAGNKADAITNYRKARSMVKDETNQRRIDGILKGLEGTQHVHHRDPTEQNGPGPPFTRSGDQLQDPSRSSTRPSSKRWN